MAKNMGLLGTNAGLPADLNLITQIIIIILLTLSWSYARKKLKTHGKLMTVAVVVNAATIAFVMAPSLFLGLGVIVSNPLDPGSLLSIVHVAIGTIAWIGGAYLTWSWKLNDSTSECFKRRKLMKPIIGLWLIAAVLGVGFYVYYYVI